MITNPNQADLVIGSLNVSVYYHDTTKVWTTMVNGPIHVGSMKSCLRCGGQNCKCRNGVGWALKDESVGSVGLQLCGATYSSRAPARLLVLSPMRALLYGRSKQQKRRVLAVTRSSTATERALPSGALHGVALFSLSLVPPTTTTSEAATASFEDGDSRDFGGRRRRDGEQQRQRLFLSLRFSLSPS
ncbi:hypothetical protein PIB30_018583 [Stylosanthes scabra]|uniref:Uncharacterized protein n=1 Tax=Stylosanthes scabra TaxID=79078 RepID=A0ABU6R8F4_9FABA|nr:hypothetical protein [Stylosanthes scabra]